MGWGARIGRINGRGAGLPGPLERDRIVDPSVDQEIHIDKVSKEQMAVALNEQTARFKAQRHQLMILTRILIAAIVAPEGFKYADGRRTVDPHALTLVKKGMRVVIGEASDGGLFLTVEASPEAETPPLITGM